MDRLVYTLAEVAEITGWSETTLQRDCRAGRFAHVRRGRAYGMTAPQIHALVAAHIHADNPDTAGPMSEADELEAARQATAERLSRYSRRGAA
jgi:hypothetical protein